MLLVLIGLFDAWRGVLVVLNSALVLVGYVFVLFINLLVYGIDCLLIWFDLLGLFGVIIVVGWGWFLVGFLVLSVAFYCVSNSVVIVVCGRWVVILI